MAFINRDQMNGLKYIKATRDYCDYLEEHLLNIQRAFNEFNEYKGVMEGTWIVGDDGAYFSLREQVCNHDLSKFSKEEFTQYRAYFYPVYEKGELIDLFYSKEGFNDAWTHHYENNSHHFERISKTQNMNYIDIAHMVIDLMAMSYRFGDSPREFYIKNKDKILSYLSVCEDYEAKKDFLEDLLVRVEPLFIKKRNMKIVKLKYNIRRLMYKVLERIGY